MYDATHLYYLDKSQFTSLSNKCVCFVYARHNVISTVFWLDNQLACAYSLMYFSFPAFSHIKTSTYLFLITNHFCKHFAKKMNKSTPANAYTSKFLLEVSASTG